MIAVALLALINTWNLGRAQAPSSPRDGRSTNTPTLNLPAETLVEPRGVAPGARHIIGLQQAAGERIRVHSQNGRTTLVVRGAPLSEVLTALAESEGLNMVLAAPVDSLVTVSLSDRTLPEALNALLAAGGHTWTVRNDVIYVTSLNDGSVAPDVQGRHLRVYELDFASAVDIDAAIKGLLSPVGQSWVSQGSSIDNRRTKEVVTVEDLPMYLARIDDYVAQMDQPPRQVLIEVHVLQVDLSDDNRHGVNLNHLASIGNLQLDLQATGFANPTAPQAFFLQATGPNFTGLVEALKTTTVAKTLASPRIIAVNGQESRIQVGEQLGFRVTTTTETSTLESVEFLDVGVVLTVTPHISRDGRVLMRIRPEVSSGNVNPVTGLPEEETTEVQTDVLLHSGQGMVIGGLIQENDNINANKYLGLGDSRLLGPLFQRRQSTKSRSEIVVALMPHVLPLTPVEQCRNDSEFSRVRDPLFHGPLCRNPRPYEPRLPDVCVNPQPTRLRWPCCCDDCDAGCYCNTWNRAGKGPQRLPATHGSTAPDQFMPPTQPTSSHDSHQWEVIPTPSATPAFSRRSADYQARPATNRAHNRHGLRRLPPIADQTRY